MAVIKPTSLALVVVVSAVVTPTSVATIMSIRGAVMLVVVVVISAAAAIIVVGVGGVTRRVVTTTVVVTTAVARSTTTTTTAVVRLVVMVVSSVVAPAVAVVVGAAVTVGAVVVVGTGGGLRGGGLRAVAVIAGIAAPLDSHSAEGEAVATAEGVHHGSAVTGEVLEGSEGLVVTRDAGSLLVVVEPHALVEAGHELLGGAVVLQDDKAQPPRAALAVSVDHAAVERGVGAHMLQERADDFLGDEERDLADAQLDPVVREAGVVLRAVAVVDGGHPGLRGTVNGVEVYGEELRRWI